VERYEFIRMVSADFPIATLCEVMEVSRTAYYRYIRGASYQPATAKQEQLKAVEEIFWQHKRRYGQRRILVDLQEWPAPGAQPDAAARLGGHPAPQFCSPYHR
jgi:hypothetical protein